MVIKSTYYIVKNFITKISFRKFKRSKYLFIVDNDFEKYPINNIEYYNLKKIYIKYLPIVYFSKLSLFKDKYLSKILIDIKPHKVISNNLNIFGYKFKKIDKNIQYLIYQHSYIYDIEIEKFRELYKEISVDAFFCFDTRHKLIFSKLLNTDFLIIGSFRNNFIKINNFRKLNRINYISEFRSKDQLYFSKVHELYLIKLLGKFCKKNNISLFISLNSNRSDKIISRKKEISYFKNIIGDFDYNNLNVYQNSFSSKLTFSISSNAGIEILSRNIPAVYYDLISIDNNKYKNPYFSKSSLFYYNKKVTYISFERKLKKLLKLIDSKNIKNISKTIRYDKNNKIFMKHLNS